MKHVLALALSLVLLVGCGRTPAATEPPPTQTPWIVVVTSTSAAQETGEALPTAVQQPAATARATATRAPANVTPGATRAATGSLPAASATAEPPLTPSREPTAAPSTGAMHYPPPRLLEPPAGQPVSWGSTALMIWTSVGELKEDEYYHVHLERRPKTAGQEWYGDYVLTKETQFRAEVLFLAPFHLAREHGEATVYWWVRVVQKTGEDENGKPIGVDISPYSEERTLMLDPKP